MIDTWPPLATNKANVRRGVSVSWAKHGCFFGPCAYWTFIVLKIHLKTWRYIYFSSWMELIEFGGNSIPIDSFFYIFLPRWTLAMSLAGWIEIKPGDSLDSDEEVSNCDSWKGLPIPILMRMAGIGGPDLWLIDLYPCVAPQFLNACGFYSAKRCHGHVSKLGIFKLCNHAKSIFPLFWQAPS